MSDGLSRYARVEYERRWLLREFPATLDVRRPWSRITDHYIDGTRFRLRRRVRPGDGEVVWKLTQKFPQGEGAIHRATITNTYLTDREAEVFGRLPGRALVKDRWVLCLDGADYAVDRFGGRLAGLLLAEREYPTHEALLASPPPPLQGVEVTDRVEFSGGALAGRSFDDVLDFVASILQR